MKRFLSFLFATMLVACVISCKEATKNQEGSETAEATEVEVKTPAPGETVIAMMNLNKDGKFVEAVEKYMYMSEEDKKEFEAGKADFNEMMAEAINSFGGIVSCEILEEKVDGDKAVVKYEMKYGNGTSDTQEGKLILVDGKWLCE